MLTLYILLLLMLVCALGLLAVPFVRNKKFLSKSFVALICVTSFTAVGLYWHSSDNVAMQQWLTQGKQHYDLMVELKELGGIDGMIQRINLKLQANPDDAQGWFILGKLYLFKQDAVAAKAAFTKAHTLKPDDQQIDAYYQFIIKQ